MSDFDPVLKLVLDSQADLDRGLILTREVRVGNPDEPEKRYRLTMVRVA